MHELKNWTAMEKGICYLGELAMVEMLYEPTLISNDPYQEHNPEQVRRTSCVPWKFTRTALEKYTRTLAGMYEREQRRSLLFELIITLHNFGLGVTRLPLFFPSGKGMEVVPLISSPCTHPA